MKISFFSAAFSVLVISANALYAQSSPATIGTRDGVSYTVIKGSEFIKSDPLRCGYNDLGTANVAKFRTDFYEYEQYDKGKLVKRWREAKEVFIDCVKI